jgi:hypothetical protein
VHLNYKNPYLSPFEEFQRFKTHPAIRDTFEGGKRIAYGARAITEGGWQSVPKLVFPGGALIGCSAGFVNVPRIKGSHNAMLSGMLAAEHWRGDRRRPRAMTTLVSRYEKAGASSDRQGPEAVRNVKPLWSKFGTYRASRSAASTCGLNTLFGFSLFGTLKHGKTDAASLEAGARHKKIDYPKPDGVLTFDRLSSVFLSNTNHEEDQPVHLRSRRPTCRRRPSTTSSPALDALLPGRRLRMGGQGRQRAADPTREVVINAQNCVHCKTCDIKDPNQNINWVPPQGGAFDGACSRQQGQCAGAHQRNDEILHGQRQNRDGIAVGHEPQGPKTRLPDQGHCPNAVQDKISWRCALFERLLLGQERRLRADHYIHLSKAVGAAVTRTGENVGGHSKPAMWCTRRSTAVSPGKWRMLSPARCAPSRWWTSRAAVSQWPGSDARLMC